MSNAAKGEAVDGPIGASVVGARPPDRMILLRLLTADLVSRLAAVLGARPAAIVPSEPAAPSPAGRDAADQAAGVQQSRYRAVRRQRADHTKRPLCGRPFGDIVERGQFIRRLIRATVPQTGHGLPRRRVDRRAGEHGLVAFRSRGGNGVVEISSLRVKTQSAGSRFAQTAVIAGRSTERVEPTLCRPS
jgi:hypothetical protein